MKKIHWVQESGVDRPALRLPNCTESIDQEFVKPNSSTLVSTRVLLRPYSRRTTHHSPNQPSHSLLKINDESDILQSRIITLLSSHRPALTLSVIKSMKQSLTRSYKTGIMGGINSLSISPLCAAPKRPSGEINHIWNVSFICRSRINRSLNCDPSYPSSRHADRPRSRVKK